MKRGIGVSSLLVVSVAFTAHADQDPGDEAIRALVADVLADADTRASLLDDGALAGYDSGFFIRSADDSFALKLGAEMRFRFIANHQRGDDVDHERWGFEHRETKLSVTGHVTDRSWRYKISGSFSRSTGAYGSSDAYVEHDLGHQVALRIGQFKPPFMHEYLVSATRQLAVERSLVNAALNQGRSQGIQVAWHNDQWSAAGMLHDGFGRDETPWHDDETNFALTGRVELILAGERSQFRDFASNQGNAFGCLVGAALHYEQGESGTADPDEELWAWTADVSLERAGYSAAAAITGYDIDSTGTAPWGAVIQGSVPLVAEKWDAFARWEYGDADDGSDDLNLLTIGVNRYLHGHKLKLTGDAGYAFNAVTSGWASDSAGWREDTAGEDGQLVLRAQLQFVF